jgi:alkylation response protein AidB-like acyl-CoA dehydrogenase
MDLSLSVEQEVLRGAVSRYCRERLQKGEVPTNGTAFNREHWEVFASLGWLGILLPEEVGGINGTIIDACIVMEEFGRNLVTEPFLPCTILAAKTIQNAPDVEKRNALLERLVKGELMAVLAHSEPQSRGEVKSVQTTAQPNKNGGYTLNGKKSMVLAGSIAEKFLVSAVMGDGAENGTGVYIVDRETPGLACRGYRTLDGKSAADLVMENVEIASEALLIPKESGLAAVEEATDYATIGLCAEAVGAMDDVITVTAEYLKNRRAYGSTLSKFQALQHRLAEMMIDLELSRSILLNAFAAFSGTNVQERHRSVSCAKALVGSSTKFVSSNGIQLHGGQGMVDDYLIGRHFKQLAVIEGIFGNSDFHWERCVSNWDQGLLVER